MQSKIFLVAGHGDMDVSCFCFPRYFDSKCKELSLLEKISKLLVINSVVPFFAPFETICPVVQKLKIEFLIPGSIHSYPENYSVEG